MQLFWSNWKVKSVNLLHHLMVNVMHFLPVYMEHLKYCSLDCCRRVEYWLVTHLANSQLFFIASQRLQWLMWWQNICKLMCQYCNPWLSFSLYLYIYIYTQQQPVIWCHTIKFDQNQTRGICLLHGAYFNPICT